MGVRIRHPDLEVEVEVTASAVPHHQRAGWAEIPGQDEQGEVWPELQAQVLMRHPTLPQVIHVAAGSVASARAQGWILVEDEAAEQPSPTTPQRLQGSHTRQHPTI